MVILALIPIVHIAGIPFGPFVGGYFGISSAAAGPGSQAAKALKFGAWMGLVMLLISTAVSAILTAMTGLNPLLIWLPAVVIPLYTGSMGGLGAMFAELRSDQ